MSLPTVDQLFARIKTEFLYPPFYELSRQLAQTLLDQNEVFYATSGIRTFSEQDALFAKGRTAPGGKVTNAKGGYSAHQYGVAVDWAHDIDLDKPGLQPGWKKSEYQALADVAKALDLDPGHNWVKFPDSPHVQLNLRNENITMDQLRMIYVSQGGQPAVWDFLDGFAW